MNLIVKRNVTAQCWEDSDFPTLCSFCLGSDPALRMTKEKFGTECKVCLKPYTTFRWCPGSGMRFRKTLICPTCSQAKHVCQSCILDLKYGLPVQVRDRILGIEDETPEQITNRDHYFHNRKVAFVNFDRGTNGSAGKETLIKMSGEFRQNNDLLKYRNLPFVCSFYLKGECKRGDSCPYSHDPLAETEMNRTKIMNRYFGRKDPIAEQILQNFKNYPPALNDKTISSVCLHNFNWVKVKEEEIRGVFGLFGDIKSIVIIKEESIAFVNFLLRSAADSAVDKYLETGLELNGCTMSVSWAYGKPKGPVIDFSAKNVSSLNEEHNEDISEYKRQKTKLPLPGSSSIKYSSMDPSQLGTIVRKR